MGDSCHAGRAGPLRFLACAVIVGILCGRAAPGILPWLIPGAGASVVAVAWLRRGRVRAAGCWSLIAVAALSAAWFTLRVHHATEYDVRRYVTAEPQLAQVIGVVDGPPWLRTYDSGPFGRFNWEPPATLATLRVESVLAGGGWRPAEGRLLLRIAGAAPGLREGQRVHCSGWLAAIEGPPNPGDHDFAATLADRGVYGRLSLPGPANCRRLSDPPLTPANLLRQLRWRSARIADEALSLGLEDDSIRLGLLRTLLLGQRSGDLRDVRDQFTRVGLAHVLSISGAHLVILMALVWGVARVLFARPSRAAALSLAVLVLYLMAIPAYVPIVRAGIASGVFLLGLAGGRRVSAIDLLALATVVVLVWRPMDLFSPGFQLSFGGVWALLQWTRPAAEWLYPPPLVPLRSPPWWDWPARRSVEACAASLVAFAFTMPIVAHHFGVISPLAAALSVTALVPITALLWVGYVKVLIGPLLPSASLLLAGPVAWLTDVMLGLVAHASSWRISSLQLPTAPTAAWALTALVATAALFAGVFARRRAALGCVGVGLLLWLSLPQTGLFGPRDAPAAELVMIAVGDGSCFVLRLPAADHVLVFDCGSGAYLDVGERSVVPTLRKLGIRRVDTLIVSHADLDHFSGVLDLADAMPVGRILMPPQLPLESGDAAKSAAAFLLSELRRRDLPVATFSRGWREGIGGAELDLLWPPADFRSARSNDHSAVLSVRVAGRRLLLHGDVQQETITRLLDLEDLAADVTDLPHHGSVIDASPDWLAAVNPRIVLQSSGHARLRDDAWASLLPLDALRFITARDGMTRIAIAPTGEMRAQTHRNPPGLEPSGWAVGAGDTAAATAASPK